MDQQPPQENKAVKGAELIMMLFRPADDLSATVLRGHLAVEQRLITKLEQRFPYPQALNIQRQSFSRLVQLAKAFTYCEDNAWVWKALNALSDARNHLAHDLNAPYLWTKVEQFLTHAEVPYPTLKLTSDGDLLTRLRNAIACMCAIIESQHVWRETGTHGP
jgi:hypothetical protein